MRGPAAYHLRLISPCAAPGVPLLCLLGVGIPLHPLVRTPGALSGVSRRL